jgi:hypothetical protein
MKKHYKPETQAIIDSIFKDLKETSRNEFNTTQNPWHACLKARIATLDLLANLTQEDLGKESYHTLHTDIEKIKKRIERFGKKHPKKDSEINEKEIDGIIEKMKKLKIDHID